MSPRKGKLGDNGCYVNSVHDDLDEFFDKIRERFEREEIVSTYSFPKLTKHEMIQVEIKNKDILKKDEGSKVRANRTNSSPNLCLEDLKNQKKMSTF